MHIAEVVTIAKSLPLLRLNTYKSLILSYSADYRRIFGKNFYYNEKIGYLLPESSNFLYVFVAYFRLLIAFFCFLLVFL